ncbi:unnamed protein product [Mytilus edulis]|uniref:Heat shock protein 70 n=1 Tax=Mytilus edulis TaxID=6550 RepID=A0A8S3QI19_MYTED|nr:unnamed protein product [Mytilus edulis]
MCNNCDNMCDNCTNRKLHPSTVHTYLSTRTLSSGGRSTLDAFAPGTQYLILDAGGGTVDITVQEIKDDGDIKQIYMANGGDWGGTKVDEAFDEFLTEIVGSDTVDKFRKDDKVDYLGLCREFEVKKRSIRPDSTAKITIRIPLSLSERFQEVKGVSLKSSFKSNKSMSWVGDKLRVDPDTAKSSLKNHANALLTI